jgi:ABC-2 type transport system ATP-binding protein
MIYILWKLNDYKQGVDDMTAIEINNLTKKYDDKTAVSQLNLSIEQGELFALLGVNGAGKTTTIKMLSCLLVPTSGDALLLGNSIVKNPFSVKEMINLSPQETAVAGNLTVRENLEMIAEIYGSTSKEAVKKTEEMLEAFSLEEVAKDKAKTLSGGMQRRLSIAMALISSPKILFLDEPTLGLDVLARRELWALIRKLKRKITIILTTHYMEEAEALSDRIGVMAKGRLKAVGTAEELISLTKAKNFEDAFVALATEMEGIQ